MADQFEQLPADMSPLTRKWARFLVEAVKKAMGASSATTNITTGTTSGSDDTTAPSPPSEISVVKHSDHIRLEWANPTDKDLRSISIFRANSNSGGQVIGAVSAPQNYFEDSKADLLADNYYWLQAIDSSGNPSALYPLVAGEDHFALASEVPVPGNLRCDEWSGKDLTMRCDAVAGFGVTGYRWEIVGRRAVDTVEPEFVYSFDANSTDGLTESVTVRARAIKANGGVTEFASAVFTHKLPAAPAGGSVSMNSLDLGFIVQVNPIQNPVVTGFDFYLGDKLLEENYGGTAFLHKTHLAQGEYVFKVFSRNIFGQVSVPLLIPAAVQLPGAPTALNSRVIDNTAVIDWEAPVVNAGQLPVKTYEVWKAKEGEAAAMIGEKTGTFTTDIEYNPGRYIYEIKAVDVAGNVGPGAQVICIIERPNFTLLADLVEDFAAATVTNMHLGESGLLGPVDTSKTWEQIFVGSGTLIDPQYPTVDDYPHPYLFLPTPLTAAYEWEYDYEAIVKQRTQIQSASIIENHGCAIRLFIATKEVDTDPWNEVEAESIVVERFRYVRTRIEITSDGTQWCLVKRRQVVLSSRRRSEVHTFEITDAAAGVVVEFDQPFVAIAGVNVSIKAGSQALVVVWDDGSGTPIPSITLVGFIDGLTQATASGTVTVEGF